MYRTQAFLVGSRFSVCRGTLAVPARPEGRYVQAGALVSFTFPVESAPSRTHMVICGNFSLRKNRRWAHHRRCVRRAVLIQP